HQPIEKSFPSGYLLNIWLFHANYQTKKTLPLNRPTPLCLWTLPPYLFVSFYPSFSNANEIMSSCWLKQDVWVASSCDCPIQHHFNRRFNPYNGVHMPSRSL